MHFRLFSVVGVVVVLTILLTSWLGQNTFTRTTLAVTFLVMSGYFTVVSFLHLLHWLGLNWYRWKALDPFVIGNGFMHSNEFYGFGAMMVSNVVALAAFLLGLSSLYLTMRYSTQPGESLHLYDVVLCTLLSGFFYSFGEEVPNEDPLW